MRPDPRSAKWFLVCSAEYGTVVPVLDFGEGPTEYGRDCQYVRTRTTHRAKVLFLRAQRRLYQLRSKPGWMDDGNPFNGMIVERIDNAPEAL